MKVIRGQNTEFSIFSDLIQVTNASSQIPDLLLSIQTQATMEFEQSDIANETLVCEVYFYEYLKF